MTYHDELILLARQMVDRNHSSPVEAELRRGVSTAYYALFHLLIKEATDRLVTTASIRPRVARTFEHKHMRAVCVDYAQYPVHGAGQHLTEAGAIIPAAIVDIAATFVALYEARLQADYVLSKSVTFLQAAADVERAEKAFGDWRLAQSHAGADVFLAELWCRGMPKR